MVFPEPFGPAMTIRTGFNALGLSNFSATLCELLKSAAREFSTDVDALVPHRQKPVWTARAIARQSARILGQLS